jgi:hypothetical protein
MRTTGGRAIKTLLTALFVAFLIVAVLGLLRVPFAVRFWRRMQWLLWVYFIVVVLAAVRLYLTG